MPDLSCDMPNMTAKEARAFDETRIRQPVGLMAVSVYAMHARKGYIHIEGVHGEKCRTFDDYCKSREIDRSTAYHWIDQVRIMLDVRGMGLSDLMDATSVQLPSSAMTRELIKLPDPDLRRQAYNEVEAWRENCEAAGKLPNGEVERTLAQIRRRLMPVDDKQTNVNECLTVRQNIEQEIEALSKLTESNDPPKAAQIEVKSSTPTSLTVGVVDSPQGVPSAGDMLTIIVNKPDDVEPYSFTTTAMPIVEERLAEIREHVKADADLSGYDRFEATHIEVECGAIILYSSEIETAITIDVDQIPIDVAVLLAQSMRRTGRL